jgi:hypothetical protein
MDELAYSQECGWLTGIPGHIESHGMALASNLASFFFLTTYSFWKDRLRNDVRGESRNNGNEGGRYDKRTAATADARPMLLPAGHHHVDRAVDLLVRNRCRLCGKEDFAAGAFGSLRVRRGGGFCVTVRIFSDGM